MNKMLMKRVIIDVQNEGCPEAHIELPPKIRASK
jgi:hypothetical protein